MDPTERVHSSTDAAGSFALPHRDAATDLAAQLVDASPDGIVVADRQGTITLVNRRVEEMFGYERGALVGQAVEMLLPVSQRQVHTAHRLRYVAQPRVRPMGGALDLWARRADGAEFPVEVSLSPFSPGGEPLVIATVRDVSARRAADQHMRNMSHLLDSITEAVYLVDPDTLGFTYVNAAACSQTGYDDAALLDMTPLHLLPELSADALREQVSTLTSATGVVTVTTLLRRRDGIDIPVECAIDLPPALRGQPVQLVVIVRDISARLALEAETRAARELVTLTNDRERIARDLHDTVIQDLFASGLTLHAAAMRADAHVQGQIMDVVDRHDDIIRKVRVTIFGLTHRHTDAASLRDQAQTVVDEAARILGFAPSFSVSGAVDGASTSEIIAEAVPVLREALSNVARHAGATRVSVDLEHANGVLTMRVTDNGIGLPERPDGAGHGLHNLAQRASLLGGVMTLAAAQPSGTVLTWSVPA